MLNNAVAGARKLKGWRTLILSLAVAVVGVMQTADWATLVPAKDVGPVMLGIGAAMALLRTVTNTPAGKGS